MEVISHKTNANKLISFMEYMGDILKYKVYLFILI